MKSEQEIRAFMMASKRTQTLGCDCERCLQAQIMVSLCCWILGDIEATDPALEESVAEFMRDSK